MLKLSGSWLSGSLWLCLSLSHDLSLSVSCNKCQCGQSAEGASYISPSSNRKTWTQLSQAGYELVEQQSILIAVHPRLLPEPLPWNIVMHCEAANILLPLGRTLPPLGRLRQTGTESDVITLFNPQALSFVSLLLMDPCVPVDVII